MNDIPVLHVSGTSLAETYEKALTALYKEGVRFETQYDKVGDPLSLDATMNLTVQKPETDPMIHKAFPGGIEDLREYVFELLGYKDHWVKNMNDPDDTRWEYTYHQRLAAWGTWKEKDREGKETTVSISGDGVGGKVDQVARVVEKLAEQPFTRQAQMITWMPSMDFDVYDPPCLQSIWYRLVEDKGDYSLNCNVRFRSNDAWGANFMNMFGFVHFNRLLIADPLQKRLNSRVHMGRLNWHADSYHIYGKDVRDVEERFIGRLESSDISERVYNFHDPMIQEIWNDAEKTVLEKIKAYDSR
jgi:thymidylate synthase